MPRPLSHFNSTIQHRSIRERSLKKKRTLTHRRRRPKALVESYLNRHLHPEKSKVLASFLSAELLVVIPVLQNDSLGDHSDKETRLRSIEEIQGNGFSLQPTTVFPFTFIRTHVHPGLSTGFTPLLLPLQIEMHLVQIRPSSLTDRTRRCRASVYSWRSHVSGELSLELSPCLLWGYR
jgi:hypothetical protein